MVDIGPLDPLWWLMLEFDDIEDPESSQSLNLAWILDLSRRL
jgi:hypothetical protein